MQDAKVQHKPDDDADPSSSERMQLISQAGIAAGLFKFRRLPSYHTLVAKFSAFVVLVATVCLFTDWSIWPLRIASVVITLGNLEGIAITCILPCWKADVWSLYHVLRRRP